MIQKRLTAYFKGTVQGVGFRYMTERLATRLPVSGFVRNLSDGRVELVAEGEENNLRDFLKSIRESRLGDYVRDLEVKWETADGSFQGFGIRY